MAIKELHSLGGCFHLVLRDVFGNILEERHKNNLITIAGKEFLAKYFTGVIQLRPVLKIGVGEGLTSPEEDDVQLEKKVDEALAEVDSIEKIEENGAARILAVVSATLPETTGENFEQKITEAGILISLPDSDPVLYNRVTFPLITRTGNMEMTLTWDVLF